MQYIMTEGILYQGVVQASAVSPLGPFSFGALPLPHAAHVGATPTARSAILLVPPTGEMMHAASEPADPTISPTFSLS